MNMEPLEPSRVTHCLKPTCGKPLTRRPTEPLSHFLIRRHCDLNCSRTNPLLHKSQADNYSEKRLQDKKVCAFCEKEFCRNPGESVEPFRVRKTCSRTCCDAKRKADHQKSMEQTSKK